MADGQRYGKHTLSSPNYPGLARGKINKQRVSQVPTRLEDYSLCDMCLRRNSEERVYRIRPEEHRNKSCQICRGLLSQLDNIVSEIIAVSKGYQFRTFLVGATLPTQIYDREDALRARLKIRGKESVKGQFTREIGMRFSKVTGKTVDYMKPDLTASLQVDRDNLVSVAVRTRPLLFSGTYTKKKRGVDQKAQRCTSCDGDGCKQCINSGLASFEGSVEGIIAHGLISRTKGIMPRFSWIGSEDRESLVLGKGRPFHVRVNNPVKRTLSKSLRIAGEGVFARLQLVPHETSINTQPRFIVKTRLSINCENAIPGSELKKLNSLSGREVVVESKGNKATTKKIYWLKMRKRSDKGDSNFSITMLADGGLGIKQFVGGEQIPSTSLSQLLGTKCHCASFDILAVTFLSDSGIQSFA